MNGDSVVMHASVALRIAMVVVGALLVSRAAHRLSRASSHSAGLRARSPLVAVLWCAVRVCRKTALLQRTSDSTTLSTRLAVAPQCWPARAVAAVSTHVTQPDGLAAIMPGLRLACAVGLAAAATTSTLVVSPVGGAMVVAGAVTIGSWLPDVVLARSARKALRSAGRDAAAAIDVLAAAVSAGVPLHDALELTAGHAPPAVAAAFRAAALVRLTGADPRAALIAEGHRFHVPALADVGDAVERQRRLGTPLAAELGRIATRLRAEERAAILEHAARRGPLGTLVVALVIAPVCLAALTACVVGGLVQSGGLGLR